MNEPRHEQPKTMNGLRLALSMFTILTVKTTAGETPDRGESAAAMRWFPFIGLCIAVIAEAASLAFWRTGISIGDGVSGCGSPMLAAVTVVAVFAVLTRGLHLDGLADVADGLGSGKPADEALAVMKCSDIGPFGVLTLVLVLAAQFGAIACLFATGSTRMNLAVLIVAAMTGRLAALHACAVTIPAARPGGFGSLVAGTATRKNLILADVLSLIGVVVLCFLGEFGPRGVVALFAAWVIGVLVGWLITAKCVRRFGGVTGDVFGAIVESASTAALLTVAFVATFGVLW